MVKKVCIVLLCTAIVFLVYAQTFAGYDVLVITGSVDGAGTDANVSIKLYGTAGTSAFISLAQSNCIESTNGLFENSSWDTFRLTSPTVSNYGTLQKLQIKHDNKNNRPGWFLGAVVVFNRSTGEQAVFYANRWLATDEGDKKIDITLDKSQAVYYAYKAPYELSYPWQHETVGVSKGKAWGNKSSGALGIYCDAWAGGSVAASDMGVSFYTSSPNAVFVRSRIIYTGGTATYALASFADLYVVRNYNGTEYKRAISHAFSGPVVIDKVIGLAGIAAGAGGIEALEQLCTIYDAINLLSNLETLANAQNASRIVDTFSFNSTNGRNTVRIGMRGDASGVVTGSGFVIVGGAIASIEIVGFYTPPVPPQTNQTAYTKITKTAKDTKEYPIYNRSWGWHQTHTYDLGSVTAIQSLSGTIVAGPSEQKNITYTWQIRISNDGSNWTTIYTFQVPGGTSSNFSVSGLSINCRYVQIFTNGQGFVDDSTLTVN